MKNITVYNLGGLPTAPLDSFHELQEDFKISDPDKLIKLQMLILTRGFKYAFKAWKDPDGKLWIIDAHQRRKALLGLRKSGFDIPQIPYEPIFAETKQEAVEEIAAYNSEFARKNPDTILFEKYQIDSDTMGRFELNFSSPADTVAHKPTPLFETTEVSEDEYVGMPSGSFAAVTKPGDLWLLGNHRLMCGDCCKSSDMKVLSNGRRVDLVVTDPPYNVAYQGGTDDEMTIVNDDMENDLFLVFLRQAFQAVSRVMRDGASIYVFHSDSEGERFRRAFREAGLKLAQCCVWKKNTFVMGRQDYQWQHEPVLYGWKPGAAHSWQSDRRQSTVWDFDKPTRNGIHPTMKPVALMAYPIQNSSAPGDVVLDAFSGSGSSIMACQQVDRICYAMDISPEYVASTVDRFHAAFPDQQIRLIRAGVTYDHNNLPDA